MITEGYRNISDTKKIVISGAFASNQEFPRSVSKKANRNSHALHFNLIFSFVEILRKTQLLQRAWQTYRQLRHRRSAATAVANVSTW